VIAPSGARLIGFGSSNLASALPKHIRPSGTLPLPMNVVVSRIMFRGGSPSGAIPICTLEPAGGTIKSALSVGTRATTKDTTMVIVAGDASEIKKARAEINTRLMRLGSGPVVGVGSTFVEESLGESLGFCDMVVMMPSTTVGAGETCANVGESED
jgi:hypothetical protein